MRTTLFSGRLSCMHAPTMHTPPMPSAMHVPCHTCPCHEHPQHSPMQANHHICPPATHAPAMHAPPCTPLHHACHPPPCMPPLPRTLPLPCTPPWTELLTDRCKNITFPQFRLRTVKKSKCQKSSVRINLKDLSLSPQHLKCESHDRRIFLVFYYEFCVVLLQHQHFSNL